MAVPPSKKLKLDPNTNLESLKSSNEIKVPSINEQVRKNIKHNEQVSVIRSSKHLY